jgi:hypothetical protein
MLLSQIKEKLAFWYDLIAQKKTAAEKVVHADLEAFFKALSAVEGKVVIVTDETAAKARALIAELKRDFTADEQKAVEELDAAIGLTAKAAAAQKAAPAATPPPPVEAPAPTPPPAPPVSTSVETPPAPVVDVSQAAPAAPTS